MTPRKAALTALLLALAIAPAAASAQRTVSGTVFADEDGDGLLSSGDAPLAGVAVFYGTTNHAITDSNGRYQLQVPSGAGMVWPRTPDGFAPSPVWKSLATSGNVTADLPLVPRPTDGPCRFVVASDTHVGLARVGADALADGMAQMLDLVPPPCFFTITGDLTQANMTDEFVGLAAAMDGLEVPFVPVPGNHDWYDGGAAYRSHLGPPTYSFDAGGAHFMVINDSSPAGERAAFIARDAALVTDGRPIIAFTHAPPVPEVSNALEAAGVTALFSGHLHANHVYRYEQLVEYNTQPLVMGGIDQSPGGFRIVTVNDGGLLTVEHRSTVSEPFMVVAHPSSGSRVVGPEIELIVSAERGATRPTVRARVDDADWVPLDYAGGWSYTVQLALATGPHTIEVEARFASGELVSAATEIDVIVDPDAEPPPIADWPQLQHDPSRHGRTDAHSAMPTRVLWARAVGDNLHGGTPVLADGTLFVPLADFGDGSRGGVVAIDALSGVELWRVQAGAVRSAPAVADGIVVFNAVDGVIHAVDASNGATLWSYQIAPEAGPFERAIYASPLIDDGVVYAGAQRELVALELHSGDPVWSAQPRDRAGWWGTHSSPVLAEGVVLAAFGRSSGLGAYDLMAGNQVWLTSGTMSNGIESTPLVVGDRIYFTNEHTELFALDTMSGTLDWSTLLSDDGFAWGHGTAGALAYADGILLVPTHHGFLFAIDAATGEQLWTYEASEGPVHPRHYRAGERGFSGGPAIAGDLVWIGHDDGTLAGLELATGTERVTLSLGAPILTGAVPAGDVVFVATFDGVVRAIAPEGAGLGDPPPLPRPPGQATPPGEDGCGCRSGTDGGAAVAIAFAILMVAGRRRRRRGV